MKRWIGMAAALVLSLGMTGCGAGKAQEPAAEQTEAVTVDLEEIRQAVHDGMYTITEVRRLNEQEKLEELCRMLAGDNVSAATIKQAQELIDLKP